MAFVLQLLILNLDAVLGLRSAKFTLASNKGIFGFHGNSFMREVTVSNLEFQDHKLRHNTVLRLCSCFIKRWEAWWC
ncbi:hypothetical protein Hanom_Chr05g00442151 [Helianthus anomalus]